MKGRELMGKMSYYTHIICCHRHIKGRTFSFSLFTYNSIYYTHYLLILIFDLIISIIIFTVFNLSTAWAMAKRQPDNISIECVCLIIVGYIQNLKAVYSIKYDISYDSIRMHILVGCRKIVINVMWRKYAREQEMVTYA